jgi:hypothetical protein
MERIMAVHHWIPAALLAALASGATADVLKLPDGQPEIVVANNAPARGMRKAQVEDRFGRPQAQVAPVGEPPISRWDYATYSVYFENDLVLHSVARQAR